MRGASCRFVFRPGNTTEESALVEGLIQTIAERQGHGRRGRVGGRFPVAPGSRPSGPGAAQEGRVALLALRAQVPQIRRRGGERRWRHQDFGCYGVELMGLAPRVACAEHGGGGRPSAVGGAGQPVHQGFRDGVRVADGGRRLEDRGRIPALEKRQNSFRNGICQ